MSVVIESTASKTALFMAAYRARASKHPSPLCSDPWAGALAGDEGDELARRYDAVFAHMELWTALRTAYIDERVRRATAPPWSMRQVVVLGAGLDTRAARHASPSVRFFEVDHPSTQADKLARLARLDGYPKDAATHVACDFETEDFLERLVVSGFDPSDAAMIVWEGVAPYLTEPAVRATLSRVSERLAPESAIVFDHLTKKIVRGDVRDERDKQSREFVDGLGEPLRWGTDDVLPLLYEIGFRSVRALTFDEICLEMTGTYERERKFRFQSVVTASVARRPLP
jgi:methyltransferase (TIGR00027 family)